MGKYLPVASITREINSLPKTLSRALDMGVTPLYKTGVTLRSRAGEYGPSSWANGLGERDHRTRSRSKPCYAHSSSQTFA